MKLGIPNIESMELTILGGARDTGLGTCSSDPAGADPYPVHGHLQLSKHSGPEPWRLVPYSVLHLRKMRKFM